MALVAKRFSDEFNAVGDTMAQIFPGRLSLWTRIQKMQINLQFCSDLPDTPGHRRVVPHTKRRRVRPGTATPLKFRQEPIPIRQWIDKPLRNTIQLNTQLVAAKCSALVKTMSKTRFGRGGKVTSARNNSVTKLCSYLRPAESPRIKSGANYLNQLTLIRSS